MVQKDNINKGCHGDVNDMGQVAIYSGKEIKDVEGIINFFTNGRNKPTIFENRIEVSVHENGASEEPSSQEKEDFENGKIDLYLVDYSFYITKVERTEFENEDLQTYFDYELT